MKFFKNLDLEVLDDAEQDENVEFKIWNLSSASVSYMKLDGLVDSLRRISSFYWIKNLNRL